MPGRADLDVYNTLLVPRVARERAELLGATLDPGFLLRARRALFPLPVVDRPKPVDLSTALPPFRARPARALEGRRVAVIAGGGAGSCVALVGVRRAFAEAGIEPVLISACSGGAIWGSMWAAGLSAEEMAEFSLSWHLEDYLDVAWLRVPRFAASMLRGFTGLAKGEAIQRTFEERFGDLRAKDLEIPLASIVYDMDRGGIDYFGTERTPDLAIGRLVRIAIALPILIESVDVEGHLYVDGGIIDLLPAEPTLSDDVRADHVMAINVMLPPQLQPLDITGWQRHRMGILRASRQADQGFQLELARRTRRELGDRLTIIDAADPGLTRGVGFYDVFMDRSRWPQIIREGHARATAALAPFRRAPRRRQPRSSVVTS